MRGVKREVDPASEQMRLYLAGRRDWVSQKHLARYFVVSKGKVTTLLKKAVKTGILEGTVFHDNKYYRTPRTTMSSWSYSSLKTFEQCPKKYYHLRIKKDVYDPPSQQMRYGLDVHQAAEHYVRDGTPIPEKYAYIIPMLDSLKKIKGDIYCEYRMGLTRDLEPCKFGAKDAWWRGIADFLVVNDDRAKIVDYKT